MKITLFNFRCYRGEHVFEFLDDGMTLICGDSGKGKSTILNSILFAIQGSGTKNISEGETTCKVTMSYSAFTIMRTCRPNRLVYTNSSESFEDDDAQQRIFEIFGKRFEYLSYIQQQSQRSFLSLSPAERLEVFEDILFDFQRAEQSPAEMKKKCALEIKRLTTDNDKICGALELIDRQIKTSKIQKREIEYVDGECDALGIEKRLIFLKNKKRLHDSLCQKLTFYLEERARLQKEAAEIKEESLLTESDDTDRLRDHIHARAQLDKLEWQNYQTFSEIECQETIYDYADDIAKAREILRLKQLRTGLAYVESAHFAAKDEYQKLFETAEAFYSCPSCSETICMINGSLALAPEGPIISAEKKRQKRQELDVFEARAKKHQVITADINSIAEPEEPLDILEMQYSKWFDYKTKLLKIKQLLPLLLDEELSVSDATKALGKIEQSRRTSERLEVLKKRIIELTNRIDEMQTLLKSACDHSLEIESLSKQLSNAELRKKMIEERALFTQLTDERNAYERRAQQINSRRQATHNLRDAITRAEVKHIKNAILSIEMLVNDYCELIFTTPLTVKFILSSEGKTTGLLKAHIGLCIFYKGMRLESASMLSGGEFARLNLCISMALASRFNSRLLLLDEVTSQLNQELVEQMIILLRARSTCKVLMVAHGVVEGTFNQIVKL